MTDNEHVKDLLAIVWVHGFKGNDVTFESFPDRIVRILEETHPYLRVQSHVFPAYETRGELSQATENFVEWLATKVVMLENNAGKGRGAGSAKVVLMGHSMGGLLIADATQRIAASTRLGDPLWPNVVATLAFDTPYLGLHPHVFKHQLSEAAGYVDTARNIASNVGMLSPIAIGFGYGKAKQAEADKTESTSRTPSPNTAAAASSSSSSSTVAASWWRSPKAAAGLGAALALSAAAAGTAYYRREDLATGWKWGFDHMTFVKNLWDSEGMKRRMEGIALMTKEHKVTFVNYFTLIPASGTKGNRTFSILPSKTDPLVSRWQPQRNTVAKDEVSAHMGMFNARENDGFYDLGLVVVRLVAERIEAEGVERSGPGGVAGLDGERGVNRGSGVGDAAAPAPVSPPTSTAMAAPPATAANKPAGLTKEDAIVVDDLLD